MPSKKVAIVQCLKPTNIKKIILFCPSINIQNLSLKELRLIAKNKNINGYKRMSKDELLRIINNNNNNNNKGDRNRNINGYKNMQEDKLLKIIIIRETERVFLNQKKEETKKGLYKPAKNSLFKEETKKGLYKSTKNSLFKSKRKKLRKTFTSQQERIFLNQKLEKSKKFFMTQ